MHDLEELLTAHGVHWDPQLVERRRVEILRLVREYREELGLGPAVVRAYAHAKAGLGEASRRPGPATQCPMAGSGCAGCPSTES